MHAKDGKVPSYRVKEAYFCAVKVEECAKYNISDYLLLFFSSGVDGHTSCSVDRDGRS